MTTSIQRTTVRSLRSAAAASTSQESEHGFQTTGAITAAALFAGLVGGSGLVACDQYKKPEKSDPAFVWATEDNQSDEVDEVPVDPRTSFACDDESDDDHDDVPIDPKTGFGEILLEDDYHEVPVNPGRVFKLMTRKQKPKKMKKQQQQHEEHQETAKPTIQATSAVKNQVFQPTADSLGTAMTEDEVRLEAATRAHKKHSGGLKIFSGNGNLALSQAIVRELHLNLGKATVGKFADGEVKVVIHENVRGKDTYIVQPTCPPVNDNLMELLLLVSTLNRASAKNVTVVIPYYGYARQDRKMQVRKKEPRKIHMHRI